MTSAPVFLTDEEASTLQAAVGRIVSSGLLVPASEVLLRESAQDGGKPCDDEASCDATEKTAQARGAGDLP
jgi:hypothetical protein